MTFISVPEELEDEATLDHPVRIVVVDSGSIRCQLLARALRSRRHFNVTATSLDAAALHDLLGSNPADVVLVHGSPAPVLKLLRWLHVSHPAVATVLLVETCDSQTVVDAFRAGAKGVFQFNQNPFRLLCKCVSCVSKGHIWMNTEQTHFLLDALSEVPALRVVNSKGHPLLTAREEQVVALVADGLSNREVAGELGLSEHTIKKYMLRIFDKLGISTRVELVLYALNHGENRQAEWLPGNS